MESSATSIAVVCQELRQFGLEIDPDALIREAPDPNCLNEVEDELWRMLRRAEADRLGYTDKSMGNRFADRHLC